MATGDPRHDEIHEAVVDVLRGLDLGVKFPASRVYNETILGQSQTNIEFPCYVASIEGESERVGGPRTTHKRHMEYPVRVFLLDKDADLPADQATYTRSRQTAMTAFDQRPRSTTAGATLGRVLGTTDVYDCEVVPKVAFDEKLPQYQFVVSGFVVWCKVFVARG